MNFLDQLDTLSKWDRNPRKLTIYSFHPHLPAPKGRRKRIQRKEGAPCSMRKRKRNNTQLTLGREELPTHHFSLLPQEHTDREKKTLEGNVSQRDRAGMIFLQDWIMTHGKNEEKFFPKNNGSNNRSQEETWIDEQIDELIDNYGKKMTSNPTNSKSTTNQLKSHKPRTHRIQTNPHKHKHNRPNWQKWFQLAPPCNPVGIDGTGGFCVLGHRISCRTRVHFLPDSLTEKRRWKDRPV